MDIGQELVDVRQLEDLLERHNKYQLELIVELVLQRQIVVVVRVAAGTLLKQTQSNGISRIS